MASKPTGVINIHGREYETVALRIRRFREARPLWSVVTEILHRDADLVILRATIADETGRTLATGHAEEWRKASAINKTSAIENAETSAIGRALAALGMGGTEFATADEIDTAHRKEESLTTAERLTAGNGTARATADEAFNDLPPEAQQVVREWAMEVIAHVEGGRVDLAAALVKENCPAHDDVLALWSQLPANIRSALKAHQRKAG